MSRDPDFTTISVTPDVRDQVKACKRGGESYNDVLRRLTDEYGPGAAEGNA